MISYHLGSKLILTHLNFDVLFVRWNTDYLVSKFKELLNDELSDKKVVFIIDDEETALVRFLFPKIGSNLKIIFWLKENNFKRNAIFEISNFFSYYASKKNCRNSQLRELYNFWSYNIFLHSSYKNHRIKSATLNELNRLNNSKISKSNSLLIKQIKKLYFEKFINSNSFELTGKGSRNITSLKLYVKKIFRFKFYERIKFKNEKIILNPSNWQTVLITGWYGTETAGDKAILGEIIYRLRNYNKQIKIYVTTIDSRLSWCTRDEMDLDIEYIPINQSTSFIAKNKICSLIFGGGPLMDSSKLSVISKIFQIAHKKKIYKLLYGCGVGPIFSNNNKFFISNIIKLSDFSFYRDKESFDYALSLGGREKNSKVCCDPAILYVERFRKQNKINKKDIKKIPLLIRESTAEYKNNLSNDDFLNSLKDIVKLEKFTFTAMHSFWRGNDDRFLFYKILNNPNFKFSEHPFFHYKSLNEILNEINCAKFVVAMRYHSHIFALGLNTPFLSIDYTGEKGKVSNLLKRINYQHSIKFSNFSKREFIKSYNYLDKNSNILSSKIKQKSQSITKSLINYYESYW